MAGNQLPVLTLDIDESKIKLLDEISEKFKSAFAVGPGGFPVNQPAPTPFSVPAGGDGAGKPGVPAEGGRDKFLSNLNKESQATLKTFTLINKTLVTTTNTLKDLFTTTVAWGAKIAAIGIGGPLGYGFMASRVAEQYRTSQGMNVSTGQLQAANNVYGTRISGTENILQSLVAAQNDPSNPNYAGLIGLGIDPRQGAAANMPKLLAGVAALLKQYKGTGVSQAVLQGHGLGGIIGVEQANQLLANSDRLPELNQQFSEQSAQLEKGLGVGTEQGYQDVAANMGNNANRIGNAFLSAVSRLNGPITKLSDSLTSSIEKFLSGSNGQALFDTIADGLKELGDWLSSDDFQQDLKTFADCVTAVIKALGSAIKWIADNVPRVNLSGTGTSAEGADSALVNFGNKYLNGRLPGANPLTNQYTEIFSQDKAYENYQMPEALKGNIQNFVEQTNAAYKLPKGLMSAVAQTESSWNPLARNKESGAAGLFQFMPGTAKAYGLEGDDVFDPNKATAAAGKYLRDNMNRYNGDIAKTLTQYNGGRIDDQGNLSLKLETVKYLLKILPQVEGGSAQHPGIMKQLTNAYNDLKGASSDSRATIRLDINQNPGSDINAQVQGIYLPRG